MFWKKKKRETTTYSSTATPTPIKTDKPEDTPIKTEDTPKSLVPVQLSDHTSKTQLVVKSEDNAEKDKNSDQEGIVWIWGSNVRIAAIFFFNS
jgi:endonuclease I